MEATAASRSAPVRSILLTNAMRGTPYRSASRHTDSLCGSTPATASNTATAPSSTRSERSTSAEKSTWPGVSMRLSRCPSHSQLTAAAKIVIPRSRSCGSKSVTVVPSCTSPRLCTAPVRNSTRSVTVVLPASTWARIPRLRTRDRERRGRISTHDGSVLRGIRCVNQDSAIPGHGQAATKDGTAESGPCRQCDIRDQRKARKVSQRRPRSRRRAGEDTRITSKGCREATMTRAAACHDPSPSSNPAKVRTRRGRDAAKASRSPGTAKPISATPVTAATRVPRTGAECLTGAMRIDLSVDGHPVVVRDLEPADEQAVLAVFTASDDWFLAATGQPSAPGDVQSAYYSLPEGYEFDDKVLLVIEAGREIVGLHRRAAPLPAHRLGRHRHVPDPPGVPAARDRARGGPGTVARAAVEAGLRPDQHARRRGLDAGPQVPGRARRGLLPAGRTRRRREPQRRSGEEGAKKVIPATIVIS